MKGKNNETIYKACNKNHNNSKYNIFIIAIYGQAQAKTSENLIEQQLEYYARNTDVNDISKEDILEIYDEISEQYTNDEIADMIEDYAEEIKEQGASEEIISNYS